MTDRLPAATVVITVIKRGELSIAGSPSAVIRLDEDDIDAIKISLGGGEVDLLQWAKSSIEIEIEASHLQKISMEEEGLLSKKPSLKLVTQPEPQDPESDRHVLGGEDTPADHYLNS